MDSTSSESDVDVSVTCTTTHDYPKVEERAMMAFYGGKTCLLRCQSIGVQWAHVLNASLDTSNPRVRWFLAYNAVDSLQLDWMYIRGLRQKRIESR